MSVKRKSLIIGSLLIISVGIYSFVDTQFKITKSLDIYFNLFKELNYNYVDDIDPEKIVKTSIDAMLETLDPYTSYIPESELDDFKFQVTGQYGGIGALIRRAGDSIMIAEPYEGSPAAKAGLKAGDYLLNVDGKSVIGYDISKVSEMLKGTPGTDVKLLINRNKVDQKITITREKISIPNVPYYGIIKDSIGYIRLTNFTSDAGKDVRNAVIDLKSKNAKQLILDLRNNPGGLLNEAVSVASIFLPKDQLVVYTKGKIKDVFKNYYTNQQPVDTITPLAVLINRGSASASEIVAGSLQDLDRAIIVGQRSYGKGLVQQTRPLSYNTQLKVTVAKYYIPSGRCIQALDYSHRNEDGSVGYIPDTLISEFITKNGRKVYDGGGVSPDVKTSQEALSNLAYNLYIKNLIFDYATKFSYENSKIADPFEFTITDTMYADFGRFVKSKKFEYKTKTEEELTKLINTAKKEKYYKVAEADLNALKEHLSHDLDKDLQTFKTEIDDLLKEEICSRYYYQKGRYKATLLKDVELNAAIENLQPIHYKKILKGVEGALLNAKAENKEKDKVEAEE